MKEILDGLLLGDGGLQARGKRSRYQHTCKHKEYVQWIKNRLEKENISFTPNIYVKPNGYNTGVGYQICSHSYDLLQEQFERWYPNGKKVVPKDIELTLDTVKHWYIGDGGFDSDKGYLRQIKIASHSFSYDDRDLLVQQLLDLGLKASNRNDGNICIAKSSIQSFLNYIGECPVECYEYKWNTSIFTSKQTKYV